MVDFHGEEETEVSIRHDGMVFFLQHNLPLKGRCTTFSKIQQPDLELQEIAFSARLNHLAEPG